MQSPPPERDRIYLRKSIQSEEIELEQETNKPKSTEKRKKKSYNYYSQIDEDIALIRQKQEGVFREQNRAFGNEKHSKGDFKNQLRSCEIKVIKSFKK